MRRSVLSKSLPVMGALWLGCLGVMLVGCDKPTSTSGQEIAKKTEPKSGAPATPAATPQATEPTGADKPDSEKADKSNKADKPANTAAGDKQNSDNGDVTEPQDEKWPALGVVYASGLNLRPDAGTNNIPRSIMHCGQAVRVVNRKGHWYEVETHNGKGWASVSWIIVVDPKKGHLPDCRDYVSLKPAIKPATPVKLPDLPTPAPKPPADNKTVVVAVDPVPEPPKAPEKVVPAKKVRAEIILSYAGAKDPVLFTHAKHNSERKIACVQCHHSIDGQKNARVLTGDANPMKQCRDCHTRQPVAPVLPAHTNAYAFHKACIDCHNIRGAGPTMNDCTGCHNPANAGKK